MRLERVRDGRVLACDEAVLSSVRRQNTGCLTRQNTEDVTKTVTETRTVHGPRSAHMSTVRRDVLSRDGPAHGSRSRSLAIARVAAM